MALVAKQHEVRGRQVCGVVFCLSAGEDRTLAANRAPSTTLRPIMEMGGGFHGLHNGSAQSTNRVGHHMGDD